MIEFRCPRCGKGFSTRDELAGRKAMCSECGTTMKIPQLGVPPNQSPMVPTELPSPRRPREMVPQPTAGGEIYRPGPIPQNVSVYVEPPQPKRSNSLGIASLVLGILAFLICWIPLIGVLGLPLSLLGLLLATIGFLLAVSRKGYGIGYPIAGGAVCLLAMLIAYQVTHTFTQTMNRLTGGRQTSSDKSNQTNQEVIPEAYGTASNNPRGANRPTGGEGGLAAETMVAEPLPEPIRKEGPQDWTIATKKVRQGDLYFTVTEVRVDFVTVESFMTTRKSEKEDLIVKLQIENAADTKKIDFRGWAGDQFSFGDVPELKDNFGNSYKRVVFGFGDKVPGQAKTESIYPGRSTSDLLVFEPPIPKAQDLFLELPAANFGGEGKIRFRIPAQMIVR